jgi:adenosylcobyric acid synthase
LCHIIDDRVESGAGRVEGLGLLDADVVFDPDKTLESWEGRGRIPFRGYEIHHGRVARSGEVDWLGVGIRRGAVFGTHWHGLLDNDDVRRNWLTEAADAAGRGGFVVADDVDVTALRDGQLDSMADLLAAHLDVDAIMGLLEKGPPRRSVITSALHE